MSDALVAIGAAAAGLWLLMKPKAVPPDVPPDTAAGGTGGKTPEQIAAEKAAADAEKAAADAIAAQQAGDTAVRIGGQVLNIALPIITGLIKSGGGTVTATAPAAGAAGGGGAAGGSVASTQAGVAAGLIGGSVAVTGVIVGLVLWAVIIAMITIAQVTALNVLIATRTAPIVPRYIAYVRGFMNSFVVLLVNAQKSNGQPLFPNASISYPSMRYVGESTGTPTGRSTYSGFGDLKVAAPNSSAVKNAITAQLKLASIPQAVQINGLDQQSVMNINVALLYEAIEMLWAFNEAQWRYYWTALAITPQVIEANNFAVSGNKFWTIVNTQILKSQTIVGPQYNSGQSYTFGDYGSVESMAGQILGGDNYGLIARVAHAQGQLLAAQTALREMMDDAQRQMAIITDLTWNEYLVPKLAICTGWLTIPPDATVMLQNGNRIALSVFAGGTNALWLGDKQTGVLWCPQVSHERGEQLVVTRANGNDPVLSSWQYYGYVTYNDGSTVIL